MTKQTIAVNHRGDVLLRVPDLLVAVKEGKDFYVGQKRYEVRDVDIEGDVMTIKLTDPDARCAYAHHHQPCECDGMGGGR